MVGARMVFVSRNFEDPNPKSCTSFATLAQRGLHLHTDSLHTQRVSHTYLFTQDELRRSRIDIPYDIFHDAAFFSRFHEFIWF